MKEFNPKVGDIVHFKSRKIARVNVDDTDTYPYELTARRLD